jgi:tetratricopeptide (TPR) repeat protein
MLPGFPSRAFLVVAMSLALAAARATGAEPAAAEVDAAPCLAAVAADDGEKIIAVCGTVIDNEKAEKADRLKALVARGAACARKDELDRAIADYNLALRLDGSHADLFNARGELWRRKGDRPKALADFSAALKLDPQHEAAKRNHKALARELERLGAQMAVAGKPSFDCTAARRPVEKTICASPELADLDREVFRANALVLREAESQGRQTFRARQREQEEFLARRNAGFGRPGYDLKQAMQERLQKLLGADGY